MKKPFDLGDRVVITEPLSVYRGIHGVINWLDYTRSGAVTLLGDDGKEYVYRPERLRHENVVERLAQLA
jgi:hypothetical protein